jgi:hypothetical protein
MVPVTDSAIALKEEFFAKLRPWYEQQAISPDAPLTDLDVSPKSNQELLALVARLEVFNPNPRPLDTAIDLLNGSWQLHYSTAREIRRLAGLPLGLAVGSVEQIIDVPTQSFANVAQVTHPWGLAAGFVRVGAKFAVATDPLFSDQRIYVRFNERQFKAEQLLRTKALGFNLVKTVPELPRGQRIPYLDITYLDHNFRIGRGGEGSLFVLSKVR